MDHRALIKNSSKMIKQIKTMILCHNLYTTSLLDWDLTLKKNFTHINLVDILLTSSVFLILPFFRTSAFWGKQENYGWLFLIIALYFLFEIKKNILQNPNKKDISNIAFFCLATSCALYTRQALIFLPITYFLYLFLNRANIKSFAFESKHISIVCSTDSKQKGEQTMRDVKIISVGK